LTRVVGDPYPPAPAGQAGPERPAPAEPAPAEPAPAARRDPTAGTVSAIRRYPVKSCRGHAVRSALVEPWGLAGDRRWALVNPDGKTLTGRDHPRFVLVEPELTAAGLLLRAPGATPLRVSAPATGPSVELTLWASTVRAVAAEDAASEWFSALLDAPVRLVYLADPTLRQVDPVFARPDDRVSLADGYPLARRRHLQLFDIAVHPSHTFKDLSLIDFQRSYRPNVKPDVPAPHLGVRHTDLLLPLNWNNELACVGLEDAVFIR